MLSCVLYARVAGVCERVRGVGGLVPIVMALAPDGDSCQGAYKVGCPMVETKILCWNVNGIRAAVGRGFLEWLNREVPDILCLQETKAHPEQLDKSLREPSGYHVYWNQPERKGYGGVAIFTKAEPGAVHYSFASGGLDLEGRVIIAEYPGFVLLNVYFPNGKMSEERLKYKMDFYEAFLRFVDSLKASGSKLIICGDFNTAHKEIDLARPKENEHISGFLPIERAWMDKFVTHGYVDTFRHFIKEPHQYTWWDMKTKARERNVGWRIDYFFVTENLLPAVSSAFVMPEVMGSDHCPVGIILKQ
jgi:exodeoxyribonuclease-3